MGCCRPERTLRSVHAAARTAHITLWQNHSLNIAREIRMDFLTAHTWSPYVAGSMIGLLNCIAIVISDNYIGCSTAFTTSSGMLEKLIAGPAIEQKPYYKKFPLEINWGLMLVAGVAVGAFLSACAVWKPAPCNMSRISGRKHSDILFHCALQPLLSGAYLWHSAPAGPEAAPAATVSAEPCSLPPAAGLQHCASLPAALPRQCCCIDIALISILTGRIFS